MPKERLRSIGIGLVTAVLYIASAKWGLTLAFVAEQVSVVWPPTGIALCAVLLFGYRIWPAIAVGAFIANVTTHAPVVTSLCIAAGNTLEAVVGGYLLNRIVGFRPSLERLRDIFGLIFCGAILSTTVSSTIGVTSLCLTGMQPWDRFGSLWSVWFLGDAMGDVIVAPLVLTLASADSRRRLKLHALPEFIALIALLVLVELLLFNRRITFAPAYYPPVYAVFPILIYAALRFGTCGTAISVFLAAVIAILETVHGFGPFTLGGINENLISLQLFMFVAAGTSLIIAVSESGRNTARASLDRSEQRYRSLVLATSQVVWTTNADGEVIEDLPTWRAYTGQISEEMMGWGWLQKLHPDDVQRTAESWQHSLATGTPHENEFRVMGADGTYRIVQARGVPVREPDGHVREWVGTLADITARKQAEQEIREANHRKDEFLAMLAHELRNPLAPIRNAVEIMRASKTNPATIERMCELLERQVHHMSRMVDDLLDVSRITRGQIQLIMTQADLKVLVQRCIDATEPAIDKKNLTIVSDLAPGPLPISADITRIEQVITNLLNNAVKFTAAGGCITVTLTGNGNHAVLRVKDNGRGIANDLLPNIFQPFVQGDQSLARSEGGLGIGLTLVQSLVQMHSGSVRAISKGPGCGSEFTVRLPMMRVEAVQRQAVAGQPAAVTKGQRILVVDDNVDSAETLAAMLGIMGHEAHVAHDGPECLEQVIRLAPSIVLLDIGLPGMNGFEVAQRLRASPATRALRLIALTGYSSDHDRDRSRAAGFDHHLVKPVDFDVLEKLLAG
jgi:PAS domain S-box-containing protein